MDISGNVFKDLKIAAFTWAMVGPLTTKFFADYGATVVRVETGNRPCVTRTSAPFKDGRAGINRSGYFNHFGANTLSLTLNMTKARAVEVARDLISRSDIVMDNFTPGVMEKWGLGYEEIKQMKPDIIMLRQNGFGSRGTYRNLPAFGMTLAAMAGIPNFIGWPDRGPLPVGVGAYTDCISPRFAAAAVIAALHHRKKTGRGQLLDLAQFETAIYFILPGVLDYAVNNRKPQLRGNRCSYAAPHNVYPCRGNDRWCTITVFNDQQWALLCRAMDKPELIEDPRFDTLVHRKEHEPELDAILSDWTSTLTPEDVTGRLQAEGIPSGVVKNAADLYSDPQLRHRNLFWPMEHGEIGEFTHLGASFEMSRTRARGLRPSPCLGEHNEYVITKMLGKSDEEFLELLSEGVLE